MVRTVNTRTPHKETPLNVRHRAVYPQKALCGGIPGSFFEPVARSWSRFVGIHRQKLTKSSKNDFRLRVPRALRGHLMRPGRARTQSPPSQSDSATKTPHLDSGVWHLGCRVRLVNPHSPIGVWFELPCLPSVAFSGVLKLTCSISIHIACI